jgi:hypothetical protein
MIDDIAGQTPAIPDRPRVWRRGDPEPPAGIDVLRDPSIEPAEAHLAEAYLCRLDNGRWEWLNDPSDRTGVRVSATWEDAMKEADGPMIEVPATAEFGQDDV